MKRFLLICAALALPAPASDAFAQSNCTRTEIRRAAPGGEEFPALRVDCEEPEDGGLLAEDAPQRICGSQGLPPSDIPACAEALTRSQAALRKAKLRAALRDGATDEELVQSFSSSTAELDRVRESAERTKPISEQPKE